MLPGAELRQESIWMASHDSLHCVHVATEIVKILLVPGNKGDISGVGTAKCTLGHRNIDISRYLDK